MREKFRRKQHDADLDDDGQELEDEVVDAHVPHEVVQRIHFADWQKNCAEKN